MKVVVLYDDVCPFCTDFVLMLNARKNGYDIDLISARENNSYVQQAKSHGLNLDDGMVVFLEDKVLYGSEAANFIVGISSSSKVRYLFYKIFLQNNFIAKLVYPILVILRKVFFRLTGRTFIND